MGADFLRKKNAAANIVRAAVMAGVTSRLWKFDDLFAEVKSRYLEW